MISIMMMKMLGTMQTEAAICMQASSRPSRARSMRSVMTAVWLTDLSLSRMTAAV